MTSNKSVLAGDTTSVVLRTWIPRIIEDGDTEVADIVDAIVEELKNMGISDVSQKTILEEGVDCQFRNGHFTLRNDFLRDGAKYFGSDERRIKETTRLRLGSSFSIGYSSNKKRQSGLAETSFGADVALSTVVSYLRKLTGFLEKIEQLDRSS